MNDLNAYIVLYLAAIALCLFTNRQANWHDYPLGLMLFIYLTMSRMSPDGDINTYMMAMQDGNFSIYYLSEPFVWMGQKLLFKLTASEVLVFLFFDVLLIALIVKIRRNAGLPAYFLLVYFLSFPIFLGHQNIYRQLFSGLFLMLSLQSAQKQSNFSIYYFILSVSSHLSAAVFMPLLFAVSRKKSAHFMAIFVFSMIAIAMTHVAQYKSSANTFSDTSYFYLSAVLFLTIIWNARALKKYILLIDAHRRILILMCLILGFVLLALSSMAVERLGLTALSIILPLVYLRVENIRPRPAVRTFVFFLSSSPILLSDGLRQFL